jgi:hypothetical protein
MGDPCPEQRPTRPPFRTRWYRRSDGADCSFVPVITTWHTDKTLKRNVVRATFVQRWKNKSGYADHGQKLMRMQADGDKLLIVYEELMSSAAGWDDASAKITTVDGTALTSPVKIAIVGAPSKNEDDQGHLHLVATDGKGTKKTVYLGHYYGIHGDPYPPETSGDLLFKVRIWWAGAGDDFNVAKDGVGVTVKYRWRQEAPEGERDIGPFSDLARLTLAPGTEVVTR